jgi:hypothetical protein
MMDWGAGTSGSGQFMTPFTGQSQMGGTGTTPPPMMGTGGGTGTPPPGTPGAPGQPQAAGAAASNPFYGNMSAYAPLPYQAFGAIPNINPALIQGGDINSQLGPYAQAVEAAMGPQFQQQSDALNSDMASRGIFNSGAANASQGNLLAQQFGEVLGQSLPYAQQNLHGNQQATNQASAANAGAYGNVTQGNEQMYNNWMANLYGSNMGYGNALSGAYLNSYDPAGQQGLIGQGLGNASNAYTNAYNQGMGAAGPLGSAFTGAFNQIFPSGGGAVNPGASADPFGQ